MGLERNIISGSSKKEDFGLLYKVPVEVFGYKMNHDIIHSMNSMTSMTSLNSIIHSYNKK